jgi:hypothetical protein
MPINYRRKFVFRHDRIQQALLVESMIELLAKITSDSEILYEPFYAEIIGRAIARSPQSKEFLRELRNRLPLALVEAIRCFATPTTDYHQAIAEEVKKWANSKVANWLRYRISPWSSVLEPVGNKFACCARNN